MKRVAIIALILNLVGMLVNYIGYKTTGLMPLAYSMFGGEIIIDMGFGLHATHIYSMLPDGKNSHSLTFDPISFVLCFITLFILVGALYLVVTKMTKTK